MFANVLIWFCRKGTRMCPISTKNSPPKNQYWLHPEMPGPSTTGSSNSSGTFPTWQIGVETSPGSDSNQTDSTIRNKNHVKEKNLNEKNDSNATCDLTTWAVWSDSFWNRNKILITLNLILIFLISDTAPVLRGVGTKTRRKLVKKNVIKAKTINSRFPHVLNYPPYCYYILHNLPIPPKKSS